MYTHHLNIYHTHLNVQLLYFIYIMIIMQGHMWHLSIIRPLVSPN